MSEYNISTEFIASYKHTIETRKNKVKEACSVITNHCPAPDIKKLDNVLVDFHNKLVFCLIPKVGMTSWKKRLLAMHNYDRLINLERKHSKHLDLNNALRAHGVVPMSESTVSQKDLAMFKKVMFVREPIERLVSAFNDKFHATQDNTHYFKKFGRKLKPRAFSS